MVSEVSWDTMIQLIINLLNYRTYSRVLSYLSYQEFNSSDMYNTVRFSPWRCSPQCWATTEVCRISHGFPGLRPLPSPARPSVSLRFSEAPPPETETPVAALPRSVSMPTGCPLWVAGFASWPPTHAHKRPGPADSRKDGGTHLDPNMIL